MSVYEKLLKVQAKLKAPKNQVNSFGKYKYRSCEDILEAVKPILVANNATIMLSDDMVAVGDRIYVKASATFIDAENGESITNQAFAREALDKKGMDDSQITGTASSYARKYALNGLLLIDDTKDADTDEYHETTNKTKGKAAPAADPDDFKVINKAGEWVSIHDMTEKQLNYLLSQEAYKDGYTRIRKELAKRGTK